MKKLILIVLIFTFAFTAIAYSKTIKGKGDVGSQKRTVTDFEKISFDIPGELIIKQSDSPSIVIKAQRNLLSEIKTVIKGDKLVIKTKNNNSIKTKEELKVYVSVPNLTEININGSGDVSQIGKWTFSDLVLCTDGSGDIKLNNSKISGDLACEINGSGNISFTSTGSCDNIEIEINGSGDINLDNIEGKDISIEINGSGDVNMDSVKGNTVSVEINGSGDVSTTALDNLDVEINGSGDINYKGKPAVNFQGNGSGSIRNTN